MQTPPLFPGVKPKASSENVKIHLARHTFHASRHRAPTLTPAWAVRRLTDPSSLSIAIVVKRLVVACVVADVATVVLPGQRVTVVGLVTFVVLVTLVGLVIVGFFLISDVGHGLVLGPRPRQVFTR
ncbi:hypothetical protein ACCO45_002674 [Purpureocillium lilacinum]|uniref:Uncharacterized protein n=1 Tax=Purpureocillium lilacinum TaxID=33203 RepID=A0ACC4EAI6_PURLI